MQKLILLSLVLLFTSCAQSIVIIYSYDQTASGKLVVVPDKAIENTNFVMNDRLLVENKYVKKITVENVPPGSYDLALTCASWYYKEPLNYVETVQVQANKETTKLVPTPPYSNGYYAYSIGTTLASVLLMIVLL